MNKTFSTVRFSRFLSILLCLLYPGIGWAQSDNFDSGTLDAAWKKSNFNPALVSTSFPDNGAGKALRIQANPVPDTAPAAAMFYRDDVYSDFYMALDLVNWPGTDKDQALVLVARGTLSGNPATTTGVILNYDASQYGENPTSRRQGQFQINLVTNNPPFGTKTIAVAELTLIPGRPYRFIFQGVGSHYTGKVYDFNDLTQPVVTIEADDDIQGPEGGGIFFESGFKSGKCGFLVFSRNGTTGTGDFTIDNYYAGATDPNPATGGALAHPIAGTPTVVTRTPAERFKNFLDPSAGLSFTAKTFDGAAINAGATKLRLNGLDASSQLVLPANSSNITASLPGSALSANAVYSAQIEVEAVGGTKKSTNTFWFDTFSESFLDSAGVKVIEAEEYNYDGGQYQLDPIPVSGYDTNLVPVNGGGLGYLELTGFEGIDFHDNRSSAEGTWLLEFRSFDPVGLSAGMFPEIEDLDESEAEPVRRSDFVRAKHAAKGLLEYVVHRTEFGEWLNYTRNFESGSYAAYLRVASFGTSAVELHQVTSNPMLENQTTTKLGTFSVPNNITRYNYRFVPLLDDNGGRALINLEGTQTLRLQMAGTQGQDARKMAINYLMLVPQTAPVLKLFAASTVNGLFAEETSATVDATAGTITVPVTGNARFFQISAATQLRITQAQIAGNTLTLHFQ